MLQDMNTFFDNAVVQQVQQQSPVAVNMPSIEELVELYPENMLPVSPGTPNAENIFFHNLIVAGYNLDELKPALQEKNTALILSCAGSGKTTFMVLKLIYDYITGVFAAVDGKVPRVLVSTFLKTGAAELGIQFKAKCSELQVFGIVSDNISFTTLHAEYYAILKGIGVNLNIASDEDNMNYLKAAAKHLNIRAHSNPSRELTQEGYTDLSCIMTYARGRIDEQKYKHPLMSEYTINAALLDRLLDMCKQQRKGAQVYDFEDLQEVIYSGITANPNFAQMVAQRYDYVFIDEFQDTSQVQYEILKTYIKAAKRTIVIGDDDQCIYSWRGSDVNIIAEQFEKDWNPQVHLFTVNYRCGSSILASVAPSIEKNTKRHDKTLRAHRTGGSVTVHDSASVDLVLQEVGTALKDKYNVGILGRTNFDLLPPAILLELDGSIPFTLSKAVGITGAIPRQVLGCIKLITRRYTEDFPDLLRLFVDFSSRREVTALCSVLQTEDKLKLREIDPDDMRCSCPVLWRTLVSRLQDAYAKGTEEALREQYIYMLKYMRENVYRYDTPFNSRARQFCNFIIDLVLNHSAIKSMTISDIDDLFTDLLVARLNKRAYSHDKTKKDINVHLATVHEAKGKEWDTVILWNDTDGVFPAQVGTHAITPDEYEEERRLHYIAFTRAKHRLIVFTDCRNMSPFLKECDLTGNTAVQGVTTTSTPMFQVNKKADAAANVLSEQDARYLMFDSACAAENELLRVSALNLLAHFENDKTAAADAVAKHYNNLLLSGQLDDCTDKESEYALALCNYLMQVVENIESETKYE